MGSYVLKCSPDRDEYVYWSDTTEDVHCIGTRAEVSEYMVEIGHVDGRPGNDLEGRFARADKTGTSALPGFYRWESESLTLNGRGVLPRERLAEYARLRCADDERWRDLLEPFEDEDLNP